MTIGSCCNQFWNCCIVRMRLGKAFTSITQAVVMSSNCYHFIYERSFIDFCIEGNIYENSRCHSLRYFQNFGGWQAMSLGGGVTVMEKWEILVGWVTKVCLKCTKSWGREGG